MIVLNNVTKKFKNLCVLNDISLSFTKGKIHGIVGVNGSGKTVLLKIICGLLLPNTGEVIVDGRVLGKDIDFAPDTGILIEAPSFISYESGYRNLKDLAAIRSSIDSQKIKDTILRVGLDPRDKKRVSKYSMGMRQRLGIAQAIMEDPKLLILDEPLNGLDKQGAEEMRTILLELKQGGTTILLASHDQRDIDMLCDTVWEVNSGEVRKTR